LEGACMMVCSIIFRVGGSDERFKELMDYLLENYVLFRVERGMYFFKSGNVTTSVSSEDRSVSHEFRSIDEVDRRLLSFSDRVTISGALSVRDSIEKPDLALAHVEGLKFLNRMFGLFEEVDSLKYDFYIPANRGGDLYLEVKGVIRPDVFYEFERVFNELRDEVRTFSIAQSISGT